VDKGVAENKRVVRRLYEEGWAKGNLAAIDESFAPEHILHWNELQPTELHRTPGEVKAFLQEYRAAVPDLAVTIDNLVAEDDTVAVQVTFSGTHEGEYAGIAPTHRWGRFTDMQILRLKDGKIVESSLPSGGLDYFFRLLRGELF
jgi:predicted ester cyclase